MGLVEQPLFLLRQSSIHLRYRPRHGEADPKRVCKEAEPTELTYWQSHCAGETFLKNEYRGHQSGGRQASTQGST